MSAALDVLRAFCGTVEKLTTYVEAIERANEAMVVICKEYGKHHDILYGHCFCETCKSGRAVVAEIERLSSGA